MKGYRKLPKGACTVREYEIDVPLLPEGSRPLFALNCQDGAGRLWVLTDPRRPKRPVLFDRDELLPNPALLKTPAAATLPIPNLTDFELSLPDGYALGLGKLDETGQMWLQVYGDFGRPTQRVPFMLVNPGDPIDSFQARLLRPACPIIGTDLETVRALFFVEP